MSYFDVVIRRVADGVERRVRQNRPFVREPTTTGEDVTFYWTEGNGGCDCNLAKFFAEAGGEDADPLQPCGETAYDVVGFETPDGVRHQP